jgi:hypothetical protein
MHEIFSDDHGSHRMAAGLPERFAGVGDLFGQRFRVGNGDDSFGLGERRWNVRRVYDYGLS